jgi:hypothetical protein
MFLFKRILAFRFQNVSIISKSRDELHFCLHTDIDHRQRSESDNLRVRFLPRFFIDPDRISELFLKNVCTWSRFTELLKAKWLVHFDHLIIKMSWQMWRSRDRPVDGVVPPYYLSSVYVLFSRFLLNHLILARLPVSFRSLPPDGDSSALAPARLRNSANGCKFPLKWDRKTRKDIALDQTMDWKKSG